MKNNKKKKLTREEKKSLKEQRLAEALIKTFSMLGFKDILQNVCEPENNDNTENNDNKELNDES